MRGFQSNAFQRPGFQSRGPAATIPRHSHGDVSILSRPVATLAVPGRPVATLAVPNRPTADLED